MQHPNEAVLEHMGWGSLKQILTLGVGVVRGVMEISILIIHIFSMIPLLVWLWWTYTYQTSSEPISFVGFLCVVDFQQSWTSMTLASLSQIHHLLVDRVSSLALHVQVTELECTQEVLLYFLFGHSTVGCHNPLNVPLAGVLDIMLLHVLTDIPKK